MSDFGIQVILFRKLHEINHLEHNMNEISLKVLKREYQIALAMSKGYPNLEKHWDKKLKELNKR